MAKCERCGKSLVIFVHRFVQLSDKKCVCVKCYKELGFKEPSLHLKESMDISMHKTWDDIKDGKVAMESKAEVKIIRDIRYDEYSFNADELDEKFIKKYQREETDSDEYYDGMTNKEIKEIYSDGDRVYKYPFLTVYPTLKDEEDRIEIYIEDKMVGYVPEQKIKKVRKLLTNDNVDISAEIYGGDYKQIYDEDIETDYSDVKMRVDISWPVKISENE